MSCLFGLLRHSVSCNDINFFTKLFFPFSDIVGKVCKLLRGKIYGTKEDIMDYCRS